MMNEADRRKWYLVNGIPDPENPERPPEWVIEQKEMLERVRVARETGVYPGVAVVPTLADLFGQSSQRMKGELAVHVKAVAHGEYPMQVGHPWALPFPPGSTLAPSKEQLANPPEE